MSSSEDPEHDPLSNPVILSGPTHGTALVNPDGTVSYTPSAGFTGVDVLTYSVCDGGTPPACASTTVTVTVDPTPPAGVTNTAPVAVDDALLTTAGVSATGTVAANDSDPQGQALTFTKLSGPANGTVVFSPIGSYTYTPAAGFTGTDDFIYKVCDGATPALCATATAHLTVQPAATTLCDPINLANIVVISSNGGSLTAGQATSFSLSGANPVYGVSWFITPNAGVSPVTSGTGTSTGSLTFSNGSDYTAWFKLNNASLPAGCTIPSEALVSGQIMVNPAGPNPCTLPSAISVVSSRSGNAIALGQSASFSMTGGSPNSTVSWSVYPATGASPASGTGTVATVNFSQRGSYIVTFVASNSSSPAGCNGVSRSGNSSIFVREGIPGITDCDVPGPIVITASSVSAQAGNSVTFVASGGQPGQLSWNIVPSSGATPVSGTGNVAVSSFAVAGDYIVTFISTNGSVPAGCSQPLSTANSFSLKVQPGANTVALRLKVLLQGALLDLSSPANAMNDGLMRDDLRSQGFVPAAEPYTGIGGTRFAHQGGGGGETMPAGVSAITGPNAIVDWIFVELRDPSNLSLVIATKSALVQRDGDVVLASDGTSPLSFSGLASSRFYISVKHRNHLGAMTANSVPLSVTGTVVDFTTMTYAELWNGDPQYDGYEMVDLDGKKALWAGNALSDQLEASPVGKDRLKYQGPNNDLLKIFNEVMNPSLNTGQNYNFDLGYGYYFGDVNLDGKVKYQGPKNDSNIIFMNVSDKYLLNGSKLYNYDLIREQLP